MKIGDDQIDELLAGGLLGGPQYDEILRRVVAKTGIAPRHPARRWLRWTIVPSVGVIGALAGWLVMVRPLVEPAGPPQPGAFSQKGSEGANGIFEIGCAPAGSRVCPMGGTLMFTVNSALSFGTLGAYAERIDDPLHERIWYFPTPSGSAPVVPRGVGTIVVPNGIHIGPEHRPGRYRVTVWVGSPALDRGEAGTPNPNVIRSLSTLDLEVTP